MNNIKEGDYFKLNGKYWSKNNAYQVMELWDKVMTVRTKDGCMSKPYSEFEKVDDLTGMILYPTKSFEDNRTK